MFEFQKAQLALNEAAVALVEAQDDLTHARGHNYPGRDQVLYTDAVGKARGKLLAASYAFTAQCRLTTKKEYEPCLSPSPST